MASEPPPVLASEAEIEAALNEAQAHADRIPDLDDGLRPKVVTVPVEAPPLPRPIPSKAPADPAAAATTPTPPAEQALDRGTSDDASPAARASRGPWVGRALYWAADTLLWVLNWPFQGLSGTARQVIGLSAVATIVTSLLALFLLPMLGATPAH